MSTANNWAKGSKPLQTFTLPGGEIFSTPFTYVFVNPQGAVVGKSQNGHRRPKGAVRRLEVVNDVQRSLTFA
jgi:hypothetical protein